MTKDTGCCPRFNPKLWQNKTVTWNKKSFIKERVKTFFYMPLNINKVMGKLFTKVQSVGGKFQDNMVLSYHTSKWNMDIYVATEKKVKGVDNTTMSGKFYTRVYNGPHSDMKHWYADFEKHIAEKKLNMEHFFTWYATCPYCAKQYGENYVVLIAKIS